MTRKQADTNQYSIWERLNNSQRASDGLSTVDVWQLGGGVWRWTLMDDESGEYLATGDAVSEYEAKHQAVSALAAIWR